VCSSDLDAAGALIEYIDVAGVDHGYNIMSDAAAVTLEAYARIAAHVVRAIS